MGRYEAAHAVDAWSHCRAHPACVIYTVNSVGGVFQGGRAT